MRLIKQKTSINFLGESRRRIALTLSVIMIVASIVSLSTRGLDFGIDFTGGVLVELQYPEAANLETIRGDLATAGYDDALVQLFGAETDVLVRLPPQEGDSQEVREEIEATLQAGGQTVDLRRVESVSPQVGEELAEQGGLAMIFALMMIFAYVMITSWTSAATAPAANFH